MDTTSSRVEKTKEPGMYTLVLWFSCQAAFAALKTFHLLVLFLAASCTFVGLQHNSLDLINIYQYPDSPTSTRQHPIEARGTLWTKLDSLMHRLARRNLTVLAGDFNCPIQAKPTKLKSLPADHFELVELIRKYHLGSVRGHDDTPTYIGAQGQSSTDHILLPTPQMDAHCRLGRALPDFPVASWRLQRDHVPMLCSLPLSWHCWYNRPRKTNAISKATQHALQTAWHDQHPSWSQVQEALTGNVRNISPHLDNLPTLTNTTIQCCNQLVQSTPMSRPMPMLKHRSILAQMWHSYAQLRQTRTCTMQSLFHAWTHSCRLQKLKHRLSKSCKQAKVNRLQAAVTQATDAAQRHDTRLLFATVRKLAPKQPYRAIRLKETHGEALTASEECSHFEVHFATVFQSDVTFEPLNAGPMYELPFTTDDLAQAFAHAPVTKAVSPSSLPNLLLRMLSEPLAEWIWSCLHNAW